jgi:hypothetical protein
MWFDGNKVLRDLLVHSQFGSATQAVAALTKWSHPDTVRQTGNRAIFPAIRCRVITDRGKDTTLADGRRAMMDDNTSPTEAFLFTHGISRSSYRDLQFNHIWQSASDVESYTSLANLCVTPSFLSKLTDTDQEVGALLRYRAYDLYGYAPAGIDPMPAGYSLLRWAEPMPPVTNLEATLRAAMRGRTGRTVECARRLGWLFSSFNPDPTL